MDQDHLVVIGGELEVGFEDLELVAAVLVQADLADPEDALALEELGDDVEDLAGEDGILGLLRIDAEPGVVGDAVLGGPLVVRCP